MKNQSKNLKIFAGLVILNLGLLPLSVLARESEGLRVNVPINVSAGVQSDDGEEASLHSTTSANLGEREEDRGVINVSKEHDEESDHEFDEGKDEIDIDQDEAGNASTTISSESKVSNHGQLRSFLNHLLKDNDRISDVHISSTSIDTHYSLPAKFLWTIPVNLTAEVTINSDGSVTIHYPWYSFLYLTKKGDMETKLEAIASSTISANSSTTISASSQAHLLNLLFSNLKASAND